MIKIYVVDVCHVILWCNESGLMIKIKKGASQRSQVT